MRQAFEVESVDSWFGLGYVLDPDFGKCLLICPWMLIVPSEREVVSQVVGTCPWLDAPVLSLSILNFEGLAMDFSSIEVARLIKREPLYKSSLPGNTRSCPRLYCMDGWEFYQLWYSKRLYAGSRTQPRDQVAASANADSFCCSSQAGALGVWGGKRIAKVARAVGIFAAQAVFVL